MATSLVEFRSFGFWCDDSLLETWLSFFLQVLDSEENVEGWLQQVQLEWQVQATAGFMGCIFLNVGQLFSSLLEGKLRTTSSSPLDY